MKTAIILHGMPVEQNYRDPEGFAQSNSHWLGWIQQQLLTRDVLAQAPEMPTPYAPVFEQWVDVFERFDLNPDTTLIGHSCGGGFILRYLSENPKVKVGRVVLVAPWIDPHKTLKTGMFDFKLDKQLAQRTEKLIILSSSNDHEELQASVAKILQELEGVEHKELKNMGHFTYSTMQTQEFPELLEVLTKS